LLIEETELVVGIYQSVMMLVPSILYYVLDTWLMRRYDPLRERSSRNWGYTAAALAIGGGVMLQPVVWPGLGVHTDAWWGLLIQILGLVLTMGALILHGWARMHLGQFFYEGVELRPNHCLVDTGPYAYVRHPIYVSYFIFTVGLLLINPALPPLLGVIYALVVFIPMSAREEKLLAKNIPSYTDYIACTKRFLPHVGKHSGEK
jgi:protein-S-isoprenylcysteine O-methyltransferase Ste14